MTIALCKGRASESTTIEELAMHRALAVHIRERFLGPGNVRSARASMVDTAVEVSLHYSPQCMARSASGFVDSRSLKDRGPFVRQASEPIYSKQIKKR